MSGRGNKKQSIYNSTKQWYVGIYTRRSYDDLDEKESDTIINQKNMIIDFIEKMPNTTIVDYYIDDGYSGTTFDRPSFQQMFNDVISGKINMIVVKDLSRLGRNHLEVGKYLEQIFPLYDLRVVAINDDIDSFLKPDSLDSFIVPMKNLMNENYAKDISKKVASSYLTMAKKGMFVSGTTPFGYELDSEDKHHLVINKDEAEIVKKIFDMALNSEGRIRICKYLNNNHILCRKEHQRRLKHKIPLDDITILPKYIWSTSTIGRMLTNETYIGNLVQLKTYKVSFKNHREIPKPENEWIRCENTHEPIISKKEFEKVQQIIKENTRVSEKKSSEKTYSIYNGKLKCADCGRAMTKQEDYRGNKNLSNYFCLNYLTTNSNCSPHKIKTAVLNDAVLEAIQLQVKLVIELDKSLKKLYFKNNKYLQETTYKNNLRIAEIKINDLKDKKRENYKNWKLKIIDKKEYDENLEQIDTKLAKLEEDINLYNSTYKETIKRLRKDDYWISHYKRNKKIKTLTREVLKELIESIYVKEDGSLIVNFRYKDEYAELVEYVKNEEGVCKCLYGNLETI